MTSGIALDPRGSAAPASGSVGAPSDSSTSAATGGAFAELLAALAGVPQGPGSGSDTGTGTGAATADETTTAEDDTAPGDSALALAAFVVPATPTPPVVEVQGAPAASPVVEVRGAPATSSVVEVRGAPATTPVVEVRGAPATTPVVEVRGAPATSSVVEVRGAPATSLETTTTEADPLVSRLAALAPQPATNPTPLAPQPTTNPTPLAPQPATNPTAPATTPVVEVRGAPATSLETTTPASKPKSTRAGVHADEGTTSATTATSSAPTSVLGQSTQPSGTTSTTATSVASQVHGRVVTEITRLVSAGNGTHRMTLRLDPGALGEVRIVLTVRGDEVRVRLAAHEQARIALTESAPELHRLIQSQSGADARIVVRELATTSTTAERSSADESSNPSAQQQTATDPGTGRSFHGQPGRQQEQYQQIRWAGTPTVNLARDGMRDEVTTPRLVEQPTSIRNRGLDLSM